MGTQKHLELQPSWAISINQQSFQNPISESLLAAGRSESLQLTSSPTSSEGTTGLEVPGVGPVLERQASDPANPDLPVSVPTHPTSTLRVKCVESP